MMTLESTLEHGNVTRVTSDPSLGVCPAYRIKGCESLYIDFLTAPKEVVKLYAANPVKKRKGPRGGVSDPFPNKLCEMLAVTFNEGLDRIVSWKDHGRSFGIHDPDEFVRIVMPRFFKQTKLTSFQRQLNLYGFLRLTSGPDHGCYYHPMFLRSRPELISVMIRDRTNPWTKIVKPNEAIACESFSDIHRQCPTTTVDNKKDDLAVITTSADGDSSTSNDLLQLFAPILDTPEDQFTTFVDQVFRSEVPFVQVPFTQGKSQQGYVPAAADSFVHQSPKAVTPTSSDVDDDDFDEPTGIFAGKRFHCVEGDDVVLSMEQRIFSV